MMATRISSTITFHELDVKLILPHKLLLKRLIKELFMQENKKLDSLTYIFCSDEHLLQINRKFLLHDFYTDIISFNLSDITNLKISGEIYISIERVRENASLFKTSFNNELVRVIFHGALHLTGHKDKTMTQKRKMRSLEDYWLNKYNYHNVPRETNNKK